jgi:hypothetical protein
MGHPRIVNAKDIFAFATTTCSQSRSARAGVWLVAHAG